MVRTLLIVILLTAPSTLVAQSFSFGFRMNMALAWSASADAPLDYFLFNTSGGTGRIRVNGVTMNMVDRPQFAYTPEFFAKYQFKRNFFIQAGIGTMYYEMDYDIDYGPGVGPSQDSGNSTGTHTFIVPYASLGYILWPKSTIQPYVTLGFSARNFVSNDWDGATIWPIVEELNAKEKTIYNGRLGVGLKYYSLHFEAVYQTNLSSTGPFVKRINTFQVGLGISLLSISTVKKKKL